MCTGGELVADFQVGTLERPQVPDAVAPYLTTTVDGEWVIWAHKVARRTLDGYLPMHGGPPYGVDAVAVCALGLPHVAPDPGCTCGFHALSQPWPHLPSSRVVCLEVALSSRVLAFAWAEGGLLFRSGRQTVIRVVTAKEARAPAVGVGVGADFAAVLGTALGTALGMPDDPEGSLVAGKGTTPRGTGPVRLRLPRVLPASVAVSEHAAFCLDSCSDSVRRGARHPGALLATV